MAGKEWDPEVQLYYFGARWYDPEIGRWLSREPYKLDGPNLYQYGFNDSINGYDEDGNIVKVVANSRAYTYLGKASINRLSKMPGVGHLIMKMKCNKKYTYILNVSPGLVESLWMNTMGYSGATDVDDHTSYIDPGLFNGDYWQVDNVVFHELLHSYTGVADTKVFDNWMKIFSAAIDKWDLDPNNTNMFPPEEDCNCNN